VDVLTDDYTIVPTDRSMHWITDVDNVVGSIEIEITNDSFYDSNLYSVYIFTNTTDFDVTFVNNSDYVNVGTTNLTIAKGQTAHVHFLQPFGQFFINYLTDGLGGSGGAVDSVNGQTGVVVLDAGGIGLGNVDNTSDLNKPISTATQTALNLKQNVRQWMKLTSDYTLTSQTALQKIFNIGSSGNGSVTLESGKRYMWRLRFEGEGFSSISGNFSFGILGTAVIATVNYTSVASKKTNLTAPANAQTVTVDTTTQTPIHTSNPSTTVTAIIEGEVAITTGGSFIPSIGMSIAADATIKAGGYFEITEIGITDDNYTSNIV
jgi:hypothetical protein